MPTVDDLLIRNADNLFALLDSALNPGGEVIDLDTERQKRKEQDRD